MFTPDQIRDRVREEPFKPFRLVTSSGGTYDVHHPESILIGRRELIIGLLGPRSSEYHERVARVALMHVTAVEDLPPRERSRGNGRRRGG